LKNQKNISVNGYAEILTDRFNQLKKIAYDIGYDIFQRQKTKYQKNNKMEYDRYIYAIKLRLEAANKIGIPNIKNHRLKALEIEKRDIIAKHERNRSICPVFKPILILYLEK